MDDGWTRVIWMGFGLLTFHFGQAFPYPLLMQRHHLHFQLRALRTAAIRKCAQDCHACRSWLLLAHAKGKAFVLDHRDVSC
jgi:hypothetical protein